MAAAPQPARGLRIARPSILVDGRESVRLAQGLNQLAISESLDGLFSLEATFGNWGPRNNSIDFLYFDRATLEFGKNIEIKLADNSLFTGRISAIGATFPEGKPPEITVLAEDRLQDLRMTRRSRTFVDVTDADVFRRVASDHGLQCQPNLQGPNHKSLVQVNQSDLAFIRHRARILGAEVWIDGTVLNVKTRDQRTGAPTKLTYGGELLEFNVSADLSRQRTSLSVSGWDHKSKAVAAHEAAASVIQGELDGGDSGASILERFFAARKESVVHEVARTTSEARAYAEALFRSQARGFVSGWGVAQANAGLRAGHRVELQGLGALFDGKYYITAVRCAFDNVGGFKTEFRVERPGLGKPK